MLCVLAAYQLSCLVVAPTNIAVQEVADRFLKTVLSLPQPSDGGSTAGDGDDLAKAVGRLHLGDMVRKGAAGKAGGHKARRGWAAVEISEFLCARTLSLAACCLPRFGLAVLCMG